MTIGATTIESAEALSVGTELLLGEIVDTNSAYLAADLAERGVNIYWSARVGDNLERIQAGIRQALERSDLLLMSGGLGPTEDDMTREAIAGVLGETPQVDARLERELREKFASFARDMPERNLKQAWLIPSAETLPNPVGTAPGWLVRTEAGGKERLIVTLPGPPRELKRMWTGEVLPRLKLPSSALFTRTFKTFGLGESAAADLLGERTLQANPSVATYAKKDGVHVRVAAKAASLAEAEALARPTLSEVEGLLSKHTWGVDEDELAGVVLKTLGARGLTLATAETFTAGALGFELSSQEAIRQKITSQKTPDKTSGSNGSYAGGVIAWTMQAISALKQVGFELEGLTPSEQGAADLAKAVSKLFGSNLGLAIHGAQDAADTQAVFAALYDGNNTQTRSFTFPRRQAGWLRERSLYAGLRFLQTQL